MPGAKMIKYKIFISITYSILISYAKCIGQPHFNVIDYSFSLEIPGLKKGAYICPDDILNNCSVSSYLDYPFPGDIYLDTVRNINAFNLLIYESSKNFPLKPSSFFDQLEPLSKEEFWHFFVSFLNFENYKELTNDQKKKFYNGIHVYVKNKNKDKIDRVIMKLCEDSAKCGNAKFYLEYFIYTVNLLSIFPGNVCYVFKEIPFSDVYFTLINNADSLYKNGNYIHAEQIYSKAFFSNRNRGNIEDFYKYVCVLTRNGNKQNAVKILENMVKIMGFNDYDRLIDDTTLIPLHKHIRWESLIEAIRNNGKDPDSLLDKNLVSQLDSIFNEDQEYRSMIDSMEKRLGYDSPEIKNLWKKIENIDSVNLAKVKNILDQYGWPGPELVGYSGSSTIFLVIQHADLKTQEKYFPLLKQAVKEARASAADMALLADRIEIGNNRPQIYGSQLGYKDGKYILFPIIDELNVNKRREEAGLESLEDYLKNFDPVERNHK